MHNNDRRQNRPAAEQWRGLLAARPRLVLLAVVAAGGLQLARLAGAEQKPAASPDGRPSVEVRSDSAEASPASPSVQLVLDRTDVFVGDLFTLNVLVDGAEGLPQVDLGPCRGLRVHGPLNGRPTRDAETGTYVFTYHVLAVRQGRCWLGPVRVDVDGRTVQAPAKQLTVQAAHTDPAFRLQVRLSKTTCYVGEPLVLTVRWLVGLPLQTVKAVDLELPVLRDPNFDVFDPSVPPDKATAVGVPVSHTRVQARLTTESLDGRRFHVLAFEKFVRPRRAGRLTLAAATVLCTALEDTRGTNRLWNQYPSYFDNDFFEKDFVGPKRRLFAAAQPVVLDVRPLPERGRPPDFSGLVGRFRMDVSASPTEVPVGAPVTLQIRVSGTCPPECIQLPPLRQQTRLAADFEIPDQRSPGWVEGSAKVFVQTVRPRHAGVTEIPPLELTWFDPQSGQYGVCRSKPVPLKVVGERAVEAVDAEGPGSERLRDVASVRRDGLLTDGVGSHALANALRRLRRLAGPGLWWALALPVLVGLAVAVAPAVRRRRAADQDRRRAQRAFQRFRRELARLAAADEAAAGTNEVDAEPSTLRRPSSDTHFGDGPARDDGSARPTSGQAEAGRAAEPLDGRPVDQLHRLLRRYLTERLQLPRGATTFADLRPRLEKAGVEAGTVAELGRLLQRLEAARFGPPGWPSDGDEDLFRQAARAVDRLERALRAT